MMTDFPILRCVSRIGKFVEAEEKRNSRDCGGGGWRTFIKDGLGTVHK